MLMCRPPLGLYLCGQMYQPMQYRDLEALSRLYLVPAALVAGALALLRVFLNPRSPQSSLLAVVSVQSLLFACLGFGVRRYACAVLAFVARAFLFFGFR